MNSALVVRAGLLTTVQDRGRPGWAHLGVPRSGALDAPAAALANRLVGNDQDAAVLEVTLGGLELVLEHGAWVAVTGAPARLLIDGSPRGHGRAEWVAAGAGVRLEPPATGLRSLVAVAGGVAVAPVLGSRSTDTLSGVGPPVVADGMRLPVGERVGEPRWSDSWRARSPGPLHVRPGPRADWLDPGVLEVLCGAAYTVQEASNRVGLRLDGPVLARARGGELPSEGMVLGAVQVPPDGRPIVFLADHPPTGGYPVVAVVDIGDLWRCAQLRPGEQVGFSRAR